MKKTLPFLALALGGLAAVPAAAQTAPVATVTLAEAIRLAEGVDPNVVQAAGTVTGAAANERAATGAYLPSLSVSAGSTLAENDVSGSGSSGVRPAATRQSYSAGLNASYELYTGGRRGAERAQAGAQSDAAEAGLVEQRFASRLVVQRAFYDVLRADELIAAAEARVTRAQEGLQAAEQRLAVGSATRSDALRARIELNGAREALLSARADRSAATLELGRRVGADGPVGASPGDEPAPGPLAVSAEALVQEVAAASPAVRSAQAQVGASAASVRVARASYLPSVSVNGGYDWRNADASFYDGNTSWSVGLSVSLPLFDGYQRDARVTQARADERTSAARLEDAQRAAASGARTALDALELARQRIELADEAVEASREDLRVQRERYRLGSSTILDVLTSQEALAESERSRVAARYDWQIARAELEALAGRTL